MAKLSFNLPRPELLINRYIYNEMKKYGLSDSPFGLPNPLPQEPWTPFYSAAATLSNQDIWSDYPGGIYVMYDKMIRYRTQPFYRIKKEQLLYDIRTNEFASDLDLSDNFVAMVAELLDREDQAAQDINSWLAKNFDLLDDLGIKHNVFFHKIRVFKVDESRDLTELNSANVTWMRNKIVIEYDYHVSDQLNYAETDNPEYDEEYK